MVAEGDDDIFSTVVIPTAYSTKLKRGTKNALRVTVGGPNVECAQPTSWALVRQLMRKRSKEADAQLTKKSTDGSLQAKPLIKSNCVSTFSLPTLEEQDNDIILGSLSSPLRRKQIQRSTSRSEEDLKSAANPSKLSESDKQKCSLREKNNESLGGKYYNSEANNNSTESAENMSSETDSTPTSPSLQASSDHKNNNIPRCNTFPKLCSVLGTDEDNLQAEEVNFTRRNNFYFPSDKVHEKAHSNTDSDEEKDDTFPASTSAPNLPNGFTKQRKYTEHKNDVAIQHQKCRGRAVSLPTQPHINPSDLSRLQGMYEKAKGKKRQDSILNFPLGSNRKPGKINSTMPESSFFNRLTKKLTSTLDVSDSSPISKKENSAEPRGLRSRSPSPRERKSPESPVGSDSVLSPFTKRKMNIPNNRKIFERRGSATPSDNKSKSSRVGRKLKRTFTNQGNNLLQHAITNKDIDMLEKLLAHERYLDEINYLEPPGVSVFHQACVFGDFNVIELLLTKGADVGLQTWTKLSPLKIAVMYGHYEVAQLLLISGADLDDIKNGFQDENDYYL